MVLKYLGHACFWLETAGKRLIIDPFISGNPNIEEFDLASIPVDYILVTHAHGDHIEDVEALAKMNDALIISNYEITNHYAAKSLRVHAMNHGGKYRFDFGYLKYVHAIHTSSFPDGTNGGDPGGFVLWNDETCFYHAGDTALTKDMELIPITCPSLDFAILPVGDNFTMGYEDASIAAEMLQCDKIVACHFDTFPIIEIDKDAALDAFNKKGKTLILPQFEQIIEKL